MARSLATFVCAIACTTSVNANIVDIVASGPNGNVATISQVVLDVTTTAGGGIVTQNTPSNLNLEATRAVLESINTSAGRLVAFNADTPTIQNPNFPNASANIEVFNNGGATNVASPDFLDALAGIHSSGDLVEYLRVDGTNFTPGWDIVYGTTFDPSNFLVVEERNGNTTFTVEPLDVAGQSIAGANTLSFDNNSYQWDIGYANALDPNSNQSQVLSVLSFDLFDTTTPIGGFRILNTGNADFKFFIATAAPEPSSLALLAFSGVIGVFRRRRSRAS